MTSNCDKVGEHRYYVAETVAVQPEGTLLIAIVCTSCGNARLHKFTVASPRAEVLLGSDLKGEK